MVLFEKEFNDVIILVYKIEEDNQFYHAGIDYTDFDSEEYSRISNPEKQRQWLASRYWLKKISKQKHRLDMQKSELGKPHISNFQSFFSISHSKNVIAIIFSLVREVAIDIEHLDSKILRLNSKFLHTNDYSLSENLTDLTLIWSAKETIYKYFHDRTLFSFKENIAIVNKEVDFLNFKISNATIQYEGKIQYKLMDGFVLTWKE